MATAEGAPPKNEGHAPGHHPGKGNADPSARVLVDPQHIHYRAGSAAYWLQYTTGDTSPDLGIDRIAHLRGSEGPVGGTLLEGLGATEATSRRTDGSQRTYEADMPNSAAWQLFPEDLRRELSTPFPPDPPARAPRCRRPSPWTAGDASPTCEPTSRRPWEEGQRVRGHHLPDHRPPVLRTRCVESRREARRIRAAGPRGGPVGRLGEARWLRRLQHGPAARGHRRGRAVLGRARRQDLRPENTRNGPYPGSTATREKADAACRAAYDTAPGPWLSEADRPETTGTCGRLRGMGKDGGRASCYVVTAEGTT
ncbi:hypothetical protein ACR6C2_35805 [Streptomyces sp. INA 01156]